MKLKDVAYMRTGLVLSRKKSSQPQDTVNIYRLITLKSFTLAGTLNEDNFDLFDSKEQVGDEYLTQRGDILIKLREPVIATHIDKEQENLLIPSLVSIVRVKEESVSPRFLTYLLNSKSVSRQLDKNIAGTSIASVNNKDLESLTLNIPSLDKQEKLVKMMDTGTSEVTLLKNLAKIKQNYYANIFDTLTTKEERI